MNTDKELLELAARAAGHPFDDGHFEEAKVPGMWWGWCYIEGSGEPPNDSAWTELWNPLTDDGDALRLAVKCGLLHIDCLMVEQHCQGFEADPYAATRRAIVRAAAAIGKEMK